LRIAFISPIEGREGVRVVVMS